MLCLVPPLTKGSHTEDYKQKKNKDALMKEYSLWLTVEVHP